MRILLVEDEPRMARVIAKGLREHAYAVDLAEDGDAARIAPVDRLFVFLLCLFSSRRVACRAFLAGFSITSKL